VPAAIARAYYLAMQPARGPVFLSIPMDDWMHECQPMDVRRVHQAVLPDPLALDEVVGALNASRNPVLIAGAQIEEDGGWKEVVALAETPECGRVSAAHRSALDLPQKAPAVSRRFVAGAATACRSTRWL